VRDIDPRNDKGLALFAYAAVTPVSCARMGAGSTFAFASDVPTETSGRASGDDSFTGARTLGVVAEGIFCTVCSDGGAVVPRTVATIREIRSLNVWVTGV